MLGMLVVGPDIAADKTEKVETALKRGKWGKFKRSRLKAIHDRVFCVNFCGFQRSELPDCGELACQMYLLPLPIRGLPTEVPSWPFSIKIEPPRWVLPLNTFLVD